MTTKGHIRNGKMTFFQLHYQASPSEKALLIMTHPQNKGHSYSVFSVVYVSKCLYQTPHWYPARMFCACHVHPLQKQNEFIREAVGVITTLAKIFRVVKGLANFSGEICTTYRLGLKQLCISLSKSQ